MKDDGNRLYEKWTRDDFKMAYEEVDALRKKELVELRDLRAKMVEAEGWKNTAAVWSEHSTILGRAIKALLPKP